MAKFRFAGKVSKMGETKKTGHPNLVIWIPHELHDDPQFKKIKDKRLIIQLDDEIGDMRQELRVQVLQRDN